MRLVVEFAWGDGFTCSGTATHAVKYESAEAFIIDFEKELKEAIATKYCSTFSLAGLEWDPSDHFEGWGDNLSVFLPEVYTVDEWYERSK